MNSVGLSIFSYQLKARFGCIRIKTIKSHTFHIAMESTSRGYRVLDVFHAYKPLLQIVTVYNSKHFQDPNRRFVNICYAFVSTIFIFAIIVLILFDTWYCIGLKFDLREIALPFGVLISGVQMSIYYATFAIKYQQLESAISGLQKRIQRRKQTNILISLCWPTFFTKFFAELRSYLFDSVGCRSTPEFVKYHQIEKNFAFIAAILIKGLIIITIILFAITALIPVSYKFFGYPQPNQWQTIHGYR